MYFRNKDYAASGSLVDGINAEALVNGAHQRRLPRLGVRTQVHFSVCPMELKFLPDIADM
jgi:hypothetical protein